MARQIRHLIAIGALVLALPWASAQRADSIAVRFTVFAAKPIEDLAYISTNGSALPLKFNPVARSARHTYHGVSPVRFIDMGTKAVVAEAAVPSGLREPLFLFTELSAATPRGLRYQILVIDDSAAKHRAGQLAVLNLSGLKLSGTLDQAALAVGEGLNFPVPFARGARIALYATVRGTRIQSYADVIKAPPSARLLLILFPPTRQGALEVQTRLLVDDAGVSAPPKR